MEKKIVEYIAESAFVDGGHICLLIPEKLASYLKRRANHICIADSQFEMSLREATKLDKFTDNNDYRLIIRKLKSKHGTKMAHANNKHFEGIRFKVRPCEDFSDEIISQHIQFKILNEKDDLEHRVAFLKDSIIIDGDNDPGRYLTEETAEQEIEKARRYYQNRLKELARIGELVGYALQSSESQEKKRYPIQIAKGKVHIFDPITGKTLCGMSTDDKAVTKVDLEVSCTRCLKKKQ